MDDGWVEANVTVDVPGSMMWSEDAFVLASFAFLEGSWCHCRDRLEDLWVGEVDLLLSLVDEGSQSEEDTDLGTFVKSSVAFL